MIKKSIVHYALKVIKKEKNMNCVKTQRFSNPPHPPPPNRKLAFTKAGQRIWPFGCCMRFINRVSLLDFLSISLFLYVHLVLCIDSPNLFFCLCITLCFRVLPHSARWLLVNDRKEEAIVLLRKAAMVNGRSFPTTVQVHEYLFPYLLLSCSDLNVHPS